MPLAEAFRLRNPQRTVCSGVAAGMRLPAENVEEKERDSRRPGYATLPNEPARGSNLKIERGIFMHIIAQNDDRSEVARLREQIAREHQAAQWAVTGLATGNRQAPLYHSPYRTHRRPSATPRLVDRGASVAAHGARHFKLSAATGASYQSTLRSPRFLGAARTALWKEVGPRMTDWYQRG
jgi:hypothetical protein